MNRKRNHCSGICVGAPAASGVWRLAIPPVIAAQAGANPLVVERLNNLDKRLAARRPGGERRPACQSNHRPASSGRRFRCYDGTIGKRPDQSGRGASKRSGRPENATDEAASAVRKSLSQLYCDQRTRLSARRRDDPAVPGIRQAVHVCQQPERDNRVRPAKCYANGTDIYRQNIRPCAAHQLI